VTESQAKVRIDSLTAQLNSLNARAADLQKGIANLPAERAPYDAKVADLYSQLKAKQGDFLNLLR
jgi:peptidoglycan hydrolase CwlO-like protein